MFRKKVIGLSLLLLFASISSSSVCAEENCLGCQQPQPYQQNTLFQKGSHLRLTLLQPLSSKTASVGQKVLARVYQPVYQHENLVLDRNTLFIGYVKQVGRANYGQNGLLEIQFNTLQLPSGVMLGFASKCVTHQNKPFYGGEGTEGMLPERVPYRNLGLLDYNRVMLRGPRAKGTEWRFKTGDYVDIELESDLLIPSQAFRIKPNIY